LHTGDLLLGCVVAQLVAFGLCQNAKECRITVRYPVAEGETPDEYGDTGEDGVEEIEGPHRADADEVEQCTFHAQVGEWLVQALEDSICAVLLPWLLWHTSSSKDGGKVAGRALYSPEPTQDIQSENGNAGSGGNAGQRLFCAGFTVGEAIAADDNGDQTSNLRNGAGEEGLDGVKAGVER